MLKTSRLIRDVSREAVSCFTRAFRKTFSLMDNTMFFFAYEFSMYIQYLYRLYLLCNCLLIPFTLISANRFGKKLIFSQFACIGCEVVDCSCGRVSNICCFSCPHMKVIIIRAREKWQNFRWCSVFTILWAGRDLYRTARIGTRNPGFTVSTEKKTPAPI